MSDLEKIALAMVINCMMLFVIYAMALYGHENSQWFWCELLGAKGVCS